MSCLFRYVRVTLLLSVAVLLIASMAAQPKPDAGQESSTQLTIRGIENRARIEALENRIHTLEELAIASQLAMINARLEWFERLAVWFGAGIAGLLVERARALLFPLRRRNDNDAAEAKE